MKTDTPFKPVLISCAPRSGLISFLGIAALLLTLMAGCGPVTITPEPEGVKRPPTQKPYRINGKTYYPIDSADGFRERGKASWYGKQFHGRKTASGETFDMHAKSAAHKTLPMDTVLLVRNLDNGRETVVRVNDRGPFVRGRIIDLSYKAASEIGMVGSGVANTEIIALGEATGSGAAKGSAGLKYQDFFSGQFWVQAGSFLNKANAEKFARQFMDRGNRVQIQLYVTERGTFHRVQLFAGTSLKLAKNMEDKLADEGFKDAFIFAQE